METVSVKLVVFKEGTMFCGYSPELMYLLIIKHQKRLLSKL